MFLCSTAHVIAMRRACVWARGLILETFPVSYHGDAVQFEDSLADQNDKKENKNYDLFLDGENSANKLLYVEDVLTKSCPSCFMEYSVSEVNGGPAKCAGCHQFICTRCDVMYHEGMTCESYQTSLQSGDDPEEKIIEARSQMEREEMVVCSCKSERTLNKEENSEESGSSQASCSSNFRLGEIGFFDTDSINISEDSDEDEIDHWREMERKEHDAFYNAYKRSAVEKGGITVCPTNRCSAMYKVGEANEDPLLCPQCKYLICTSCQVFYHIGMTCELFLNILKGEGVPDDHGITLEHVLEAKGALNPLGLLKLPLWKFRNILVWINRRGKKDKNRCFREHVVLHLSPKLRNVVEKFERPVIASNYNDKSKMKCCPTPDCCVEYAVDENMENTYNCPSCLKLICTRCNVIYHENMTCEAYQNSEENVDCSLKEYFNADPKNRKLCPNCSSPIEKIGGCDQIRCSVCNCCICWRCGLTFSMRYAVTHVC